MSPVFEIIIIILHHNYIHVVTSHGTPPQNYSLLEEKKNIIESL